MNLLLTVVLLTFHGLIALAANCNNGIRGDPQNHFTAPKPPCSSESNNEIATYDVGSTFQVSWATSKSRTNLELWQNENGWQNHNNSILIQTLTFNYSDTTYNYHVLAPPLMSSDTTFVFVLTNTQGLGKDLAVSDLFKINDTTYPAAMDGTSSPPQSKKSISVGVGVAFGLFLPIIIAGGIIMYKVRLRRLKRLQQTESSIKNRHISWPLPTSTPKRIPSKTDMRYIALRSHPPFQRALTLNNGRAELPSHRFSKLRYQLTEFELDRRRDSDSIPMIPELPELPAGITNYRI